MARVWELIRRPTPAGGGSAPPGRVGLVPALPSTRPRRTAAAPMNRTRTIHSLAERSGLASQALAPLGLAAALLTGCSSSDDSNPPFSVRTAAYAAVADAPIAIEGRWAVYLASEATTGSTGTDLNGDEDTSDAVAVLVDVQAGRVANLGVAARNATVVGGRVYVAVREDEDGDTDWDQSGLATDLVLLSADAAEAIVAPGGSEGPSPALVFVDTLRSGVTPEFVGAGGRLWYQAADPIEPGDTTLRYVEADEPLIPTAVLPADGETQIHVRPIRQEAGVLFTAIDETLDNIDHNGDGNTTSSVVLALVDATAEVPQVRNTGLALANAAAPMRARALSGGERLVAFLVSEAEQDESLNALAELPVGWLPSQCTPLAADDQDTDDDVLFWLLFSEWDAAPDLSPPVNTGIAGQQRIALVDEYVATLAAETAQGPGGCDFNGSGAAEHVVLRFTRTLVGATPESSVRLNLAVANSTPGGANGLTELEGRFVAALDVTANDHDAALSSLAGPLAGKRVLGWVRPGQSTAFTVNHLDPGLQTDPQTAQNPFVQVGVNTLAATDQGGRLAVGLDESVPLQQNALFQGKSLNAGCNGVPKDQDTTDTIAAYVRFVGSTLRLFGRGFALEPGGPGHLSASGNLIMRVSEAADDVDYNNDGDKNDQILLRVPLNNCQPVAMSIHNGLIQAPIVTDGTIGALFLAEEAQTIGPGSNGEDLNGDGYIGGFALRYFRF
jgi:hypothetical protein